MAVSEAFAAAPASSKVLWVLILTPPLVSLALLLGGYRRAPQMVVILTLIQIAFVSWQCSSNVCNGWLADVRFYGWLGKRERRLSLPVHKAAAQPHITAPSTFSILSSIKNRSRGRKPVRASILL